jgi:PAS domain S-box-containing protein
MRRSGTRERQVQSQGSNAAYDGISK